MARTNLDFPDPVNQPPRPSRSSPQTPAASGLLTPAPPSGPLVIDPMSELRRQTELLKFMAGWLLAVSLLTVMGILIGLGVGAFLVFLKFGPFGLGMALLGFVILLLITVAGATSLRRSVFRLSKINA